MNIYMKSWVVNLFEALNLTFITASRSSGCYNKIPHISLIIDPRGLDMLNSHTFQVDTS